MLGEDRLVADAEVGVRQHRQDLVGAGAANDAVGVQPVARRDRSPQQSCRSIGIALQCAGDILERGDRLGAWPQRRFVGRQLYRLDPGGKLALARNVSVDFQNARLGPGNGGSHEGVVRIA